MGLVVYSIVFALASPQSMKSLMIVSAGLISGFMLLLVAPGGDSFLALLPFIGSGEGTETIAYREELFHNSIEVISRNWLFGLPDFKLTVEMEEMRQGQGIIDVVNTYLKIGLIHGVIGLSLFVGVFLSLLFNIRKAMRFARPLGDDYVRLGQSLLAILSAILVILGTTSPIDYIPIYYWALAGVSAGYINMIARARKTPQTAPTDDS